jgi:tRNA-splicing ligase RtcB (3'-phosphate/5'-hydroxy nucleic acid ligase)
MHKITEPGGEAIVFLEESEIDDRTELQIRKMLNHPAVENARIMPDCHAGVGCCVGFTSKLTGKTVPNFIGGDIGCGIICYHIPDLDLSSQRKIEKVERTLRNVVPIKTHAESIVRQEDLEWLWNACNKEVALLDVPGKPTYSEAWFDKLLERVRSNKGVDLRNLGTLGGGNHFIECNRSSGGDYYLTVHTGSRNLGQKICRCHQKIMDGKKYLEGKEAYDYHFDMILAQKYATLNRRLIVRQFLEATGREFSHDAVIESVHNYIDFGDGIWRKGAVPSYRDNYLIVALNMRDGILLCKGKSNEYWNFSAAHGAGRDLSRGEAQRQLSLEDYKNSMKDVYSTSVCLATLDEAPGAYKDMELIKERLKDTVEIVDHLVPVLNWKAVGSEN